MKRIQEQRFLWAWCVWHLDISSQQSRPSSRKHLLSCMCRFRIKGYLRGAFVEGIPRQMNHSFKSPRRVNVHIRLSARADNALETNACSCGSLARKCDPFPFTTHQTPFVDMPLLALVVVSWFQVCHFQGVVVRNAEMKVPYAYTANTWIGYDDPVSIGEKVISKWSISSGGDKH